MKIADYIAFKIDRLPKGYVFTYADFIIKVHQQNAIIIMAELNDEIR